MSGYIVMSNSSSSKIPLGLPRGCLFFRQRLKIDPCKGFSTQPKRYSHNRSGILRSLDGQAVSAAAGLRGYEQNFAINSVHVPGSPGGAAESMDRLQRLCRKTA